MSDNNLSQSVLKTIQDQKLKPKPRWEFVLKKYFIWVLSLLCLIIGSLAFAIIIYLVQNNDWDLYRTASSSLLGFIFTTLPYFWFLFLILFIAAAYYNFHHTSSGYKYKMHLIVSVTILASFLLGIFFYNIGLGQAIDDTLIKRVPFYGRFLDHRANFWHHPQRGFLGGVIISSDENNILRIRDLENQEWQVMNSSALIRSHVNFTPGSRIKIIGNNLGPNSFQAQEIRPWSGPGPGLNTDFVKPIFAPFFKP